MQKIESKYISRVNSFITYLVFLLFLFFWIFCLRSTGSDKILFIMIVKHLKFLFSFPIIRDKKHKRNLKWIANAVLRLRQISFLEDLFDFLLFNLLGNAKLMTYLLVKSKQFQAFLITYQNKIPEKSNAHHLKITILDLLYRNIGRNSYSVLTQLF